MDDTAEEAATSGAEQACAPGNDGSYGLGSQDATLQTGCYGVLPRSADPARRTVTFDLVQFFYGEEAMRRPVAEDGVPTETLPFLDFYIRNSSDRLRTMPLAPDAIIMVNLLASVAGTAADTAVSVERLASLLRTEGHRYGPRGAPVIWLYVDDGQITSFREQFQS